MVGTGSSEAPIELENSAFEVIGEDLIAPLGEPAVTIFGDDVQLTITSDGSVSAPDEGNTAIQSLGEDASVTNLGDIFGDFNGISSTGNGFSLINEGTIASNSRAVDVVDGDGISIVNFSEIIGTGDQRNGTIYLDGTVDDIAITNEGVVDAGVGNLGDAISIQVGTASEDIISENIVIVNEGSLRGRGDGPEVFADGGRVAANGSSGIRFVNGSGSPEGIVTGSITNSGFITAEVSVGFLGGVVVEDGVGFQGTIENTNLIDAPFNGIYIGDAEHDLTINNSGAIISGSRAINLDGDNVTLNNTGGIFGTGDQRNGTIYLDGTADNHTITNTGLVDAGAGNLGDAISIQVGTASEDIISEDIVIVNEGTLQGRGDGPEVFADGDRVAANGSSGIRFVNGSGSPEGIVTGSITNSGIITAEVSVGFLGGVVVEDGVGFQGTIDNSGLIDAPFNGIYIGDAEHDLTINNSGVVVSGSRAINLDGDNVTLNNSGSILGTGDQRNGTIYLDGTADNHTITNTGVVDAGAGNLGDAISIQVGTASEDIISENIVIVNEGVLQGRGDGPEVFADGGRVAANGSSGIRFVNGSGSPEGIVTGSITNSGTITAEASVGFLGAVVVEDGVGFQGTIENTSLIEAAFNGIYIGDAEHDLTINNFSAVISGSRAINLDGDNVTLNNSGSILGTGDQRNGTIYLDGTADNHTITNTGLVDAGAGNLGDAISIQVGTASEDIISEDIVIVNSGLLQGRGDGPEVFADGGRVAANGSSGIRFVNGSGSPEGIVTGSITNSGIITAEASVGFLGAVVVEDGVGFQGTIENTNLIDAPFNGIYIGDAEHDLTITNSGAVISGSRAINLDGDNVTLNNSGSILGTGDQRNGTIYLDGTADNHTITNEGLVDAGAGNLGDAISIQVGTASEDIISEDIVIVNSGLLQGRGDGPEVFADGGRVAANGSSGIRFVNGSGSPEGIVTGSITNSGTITAEASVGFLGAVVVEDGVGFQGTIDNSGLIDAPFNGIYIGDAEHDLTITNSGVVVSASRAINLDGDNVTLNNSGSILGTGDQRNGTIYLDGTADNHTITNTGVVDAGAGNLGDAISIQVGTASEDIISENIVIVNEGTLQGRGDGPEVFADGGRVAANGSSGIRFVNGSGSPEGIVTGSITNSGTITAEVSVGFLGAVVVEDGVGFQGTIDNDLGLIDAAFNGIYIGDAEHDLTIDNSGVILSGSRAINLDGDNVTLNNSGSILGTSDQRNGTIYLDGTADNHTINNSSIGVIDAGAGNLGDAISIQVGTASEDIISENIVIVNSGLLQGRGDGSEVFADGGRVAANGSSGIRFVNGSGSPEGIVTGSILNSGIITAEVSGGFLGGVVIEDGVAFEGTIDNLGLIEGSGNGLYIGDAEHDLIINNSGDIESDSRAVNLDGDNITLNNGVNVGGITDLLFGIGSGSITGTGDQRNGTIYIDGTGDDITINNLNGGFIDAGLGNSGSGISVQVGAVGDEQTEGIEIVNDGVIQGRGTNNVPVGIRLFVGAGLDTATFVGNITNESNGLIASEEAAGILIEEGVIFDGTITNDGVISGGNGIAIDAAGALGDLEVINSGSLDGEVLLGSGDDTFVQNSDDVALQIDGGEGIDTIDFSGQSAGIVIDLDTLTSIENIVGSATGDDEIVGSSGVNVLNGLGGDDVLTGEGGEDTFVFTEGTGFDTVTDFSLAEDLLDVSAFFDNTADALGAASQSGADTLITLDSDDSVLLLGIDATSLGASNFVVA